MNAFAFFEIINVTKRTGVEVLTTVLITGASSGIGRALAKEFAKEYTHLILAGRNRQKLNAVFDEICSLETSCEILEIDLRDLEAVKKIPQKYTIDCLINCAGVGETGDFQKTTLDQEIAEIQVDLMAPLILAKAFAQQFLSQKSGMILNVCSTSAFYTHPYMTVYGVSKAGLFHYSLGLYEELRRIDGKVRVVTVCPGPTKTHFFEEKMTTEFQQGSWARLFQMSPETVARRIRKVSRKNKSYVIIGYRNWWLTKMLEMLPTKIRLRVVGSYLRKGVL